MIRGFWPKWWIFLCLPIPTALSIILIIASVQQWPFSTGASEYILANRATVQLVIQLISTLLSLIHSLAICHLVQNGGRIYLAGKESITMAQLRGWGSMVGPSIDLDVPLFYLIAASLFASVSIGSSALWVGAMTPTKSITTIETIMAIPAFSNTSLIMEYPSEANLLGPQVYTSDGLFSYSVGIKYIGALMSSANSATTADGSVRKHSKADNTQFVYIGRSYGTGAAVGIKDHGFGVGAGHHVMGYEYMETGYETVVSCIHNTSTTFSIKEASATWIYPASGFLPDSDTGETSDYFGHSPDAIVAMGVAMGTGKRFLGIAAGSSYHALNATQCAVDFAIPCSVLGDALLSSVAAWNTSNNADETVSEAHATLAGVKNTLIAMADDMLTMYGAAQLMVGNFSQPTTARVAISILKIGKWQDSQDKRLAPSASF
ncbi:hypothetical protein G7Z17_g1204 [Cylindrodendrum hubeiense]|uniref:Uncharacterized protein n=1 Tax=Cylindrodendrum hubeiense TaxID=595255 RepID=A0A9P5LM94_9HYPO|nr:hypothetical protein G7Z17_g1204 [Cylindrodendrum hubeiense]